MTSFKKSQYPNNFSSLNQKKRVKEKCHDFFDVRFSAKNISSRAPDVSLAKFKYFSFEIREGIRKAYSYSSLTVPVPTSLWNRRQTCHWSKVNDTGGKLATGVNDSVVEP